MNSQRIIATLAIGALCAGFSTVSAQSAQSNDRPTVITPPAVKDGSNWSRAPFPAQRQRDDVKAPDGQAIDDTLPPNSPASNIEPAPPPATVAILQPEPSPGVTATDPGLLPTGRPTVAVASTVDATTFAPTLRATTHASRDQVIADIRNRMQSSETAIASVRDSASQMTAEGREAFNAAADEAKEKADALRKSVKAVQKASASEWENARAQLAADYEAYAAALARIDAAAGVTAR